MTTVDFKHNYDWPFASAWIRIFRWAKLKLSNARPGDTVEPLTNDHPHQRPSLSYDHISCDGQWFMFVYESLTSDHPSLRPHQCDSVGSHIRGVLLYARHKLCPHSWITPQGRHSWVGHNLWRAYLHAGHYWAWTCPIWKVVFTRAVIVSHSCAWSQRLSYRLSTNELPTAYGRRRLFVQLANQAGSDIIT